VLIYVEFRSPDSDGCSSRSDVAKAISSDALDRCIARVRELLCGPSCRGNRGRNNGAEKEAENEGGRMLFAIRAGRAGRGLHRGGGRSALALLTSPLACRGVPPIPHP